MRDAEVVDLDLVGREQQCVVVKSVGNTGYRRDNQRLFGLPTEQSRAIETGGSNSTSTIQQPIYFRCWCDLNRAGSKYSQ
jgi:hypothetical protein